MLRIMGKSSNWVRASFSEVRGSNLGNSTKLSPLGSNHPAQEQKSCISLKILRKSQWKNSAKALNRVNLCPRLASSGNCIPSALKTSAIFIAHSCADGRSKFTYLCLMLASSSGNDVAVRIIGHLAFLRTWPSANQKAVSSSNSRSTSSNNITASGWLSATESSSYSNPSSSLSTPLPSSSILPRLAPLPPPFFLAIAKLECD
mmetsp:Transcript_7772/g.18161  ORF Transcript_7772/g.18161 Transcript_7772/m.18161 type:complete len:203 (-) Transcript_7772:1348-1956(-)